MHMDNQILEMLHNNIIQPTVVAVSGHYQL